MLNNLIEKLRSIFKKGSQNYRSCEGSQNIYGCFCCGRQISELEPFGKFILPIYGNVEGALLVKVWRRLAPYDEEIVKANEEALRNYKADGYKSPDEWLKKKYGDEKGEDFLFYYSVYGSMDRAWLCKDCIILDEDAYFEKECETSSKNN